MRIEEKKSIINYTIAGLDHSTDKISSVIMSILSNLQFHLPAESLTLTKLDKNSTSRSTVENFHHHFFVKKIY